MTPITAQVAAVPEPFELLGFGLAGFGVLTLRRRRDQRGDAINPACSAI
jgi:hypothetical protein